jgi:RNA polymerase sigma-32 factor
MKAQAKKKRPEVRKKTGTVSTPKPAVSKGAKARAAGKAKTAKDAARPAQKTVPKKSAAAARPAKAGVSGGKVKKAKPVTAAAAPSKKPAPAAKKAGPAARKKTPAPKTAPKAKTPRRPAGAEKAPETTPRTAPAAAAAEAKPAAAAAPAGRSEKPLKPLRTSKSQDSDKAVVKFDPLQRYLSEISKYRLLTRDEERDYGIRVQEGGDQDAAYVLVTANLRLVVKIALEFQRVWMQNLLDLIQEGNIGLMQAVKKFDPYKNVKFSYYASFWIKAYILKFIMDNWRLVKIGTTQGQRKLFFKLKKEKQRLVDQGFDPKPKLLSERLGVSEREIVEMDQRLDGWDVSLDAPLKNDSETERIEFLSTESESVEEQVSKKEIELLLHNKISEFRERMTEREIEIFELRIFSDNPVTLQEIGDRYGISRERVRQIEKNIIRKMREFFKREIPDFASYSEDASAE